MSNDEMPDAEQLREIFKVLSDTVPELLEYLAKVMYGAKESEEYGKAVANFYKALKDAGMSNEQAFQLTREYMSNMSLGNIMRGMTGPGSEIDRKMREHAKEE